MGKSRCTSGGRHSLTGYNENGFFFDADICLRGQKVLIRPFVIDDIEDSYIGWLNDPVVVQFSNQRFIKHDQEKCSRYLATFAQTENLFMSVRLVSNDQAIGTMTAYVSPHNGTVDVGIMIGEKSFWGFGYGQDAWNTMTTWLLQRKDIRKLTAGTSARNNGMIKLMERSGMVLECRRKEQEMMNGHPTDVLYFAIFSET